ncbi:gliding motility-associated C-terminal domain-containing protein [Flavobacterium faecale]|uniref:T9SS type B sorting domain-containing protein n=1 Tax=Flavobacterium faecale TaxID=1355330 RepID=UPI003AAFF606
MKKKILIVLLISLFLGEQLAAENLNDHIYSSIIKKELALNSVLSDTVKRKNITAKPSGVKAIIPPPLTTAGSTCKDASQGAVQVFLNASGGSGDVLEWYASQDSSILLHSGSIYAPVISKTTTFYVRTRSGSDFSIRVPVVASVYTNPPPVSLSVSPSTNPICQGTMVTFTASGGADFFEFSVDGIVVQSMSASNTYSTNTLASGQTVKVRTRYGVGYDGQMAETAWGTGVVEDNILSAALSPNAQDGYVNSIKVSSTEDSIVFGVSGKLNNNRSMLLFLDTKPGGFNIANYGDEPITSQNVKGFNYFNKSTLGVFNTFDSYFFPDYCLAISSNDGGITYFADIIELKTGTSTKVNLGTASTGSPSASFGVNSGNTGINDFDLGFEVGVLKSLIGYVVGDIKFFALTMRDDDLSNYSVSNSFLSPERTKNTDFGSVPVDYNFENPNPVVVSGDALRPCYREDSITMTFVDQPTTATVGSDQNVCTLTSNSLGGNVPTVGTGKWSLKSGPGTVVFSDDTSGSSTATVSVQGSYVFTWTISNSVCTPSTADVSVNFQDPLIIPTAVNVTQPTCAIPSGSISIDTQSGVDYSLDGIIFQSSNVFLGLTPGNYTLYVRSLANTSCVTASSSSTTINVVPVPPADPTASSVVQPTCASPSGVITITAQPGVEYSLDNVIFQSSNVFSGLNPDNYTLYIRRIADNSCVTSSTSPTVINAVPLPPVEPTASNVVQPTCAVPTGSITITSQSGVEYSVDGGTYQSSNVFTGLPPNSYTLYVRNVADNTCFAVSPSTTTINSIPLPLVVPTTSNVTQPTCAVPTGSISINTQAGVEYSLNGTVYQSSNVFSGLVPNNYTLYVRGIADNTCVTPSSGVITINAVPLPPVVPTASSVTQPTCAIPSGSITIATQSGVEYSVNGSTYQASNVFSGLVPNSYTLYVRNTADNTCVSSSSTATTINAAPIPPTAPTASNVTQPTCAVPTGSITITSQSGVEYSLNGTVYQSSNVFATLAPGNYTLYVRSIADNTCITASATTTSIITAIPPTVPTTSNVTQPTCAVPSGSISITTQTGVEYSLNGTVYQSSNVFSGLVPNNYTLYVRRITDNTCVTPSSSVITINAVPLPPVVPTASSVTQPTCAVPSGSITIATQSGVEYSVNGSTYQASNVFSGLVPNSYTLYVRNTADNTCASSSSTATTINAAPIPPTAPTASNVIQPTCAVPTGSITITSQSGVEYSLNGTVYQSSNVFATLASGNYTLYVRSIADNTCITASATTTSIITAIPPTVPTTSNVTQPTCAVPSGSISITTQTGVEYSLNGTVYQSSNVFSGLVPNNYTLYVRRITDNTCVTPSSSVITINAVPLPPVVPTASSVTQPTCAVPSGSITIATQSGVEYSVNGSTYQASNTFTGLASNNYTLYVRKIADNTCVAQSAITTVIDPRPALPAVPTASQIVQTSCDQAGTIKITPQSGIQYSVGNGFQNSPDFTNLSPGNYILSVRFAASPACITNGPSITINPVPSQIQFESKNECEDKDYIVSASPLNNSYDRNAVDYEWRDNLGNIVGTNSEELNVTNVVNAMTGIVSYPLTFSLKVSSSATQCSTTNNIVIESVFCNIQKGISPDGNGSNDFLDLRVMDVKYLQIFDRYGKRVYDQHNYKDQWKGQSDKGDDLPSATYYYVIEFNNGKMKTGWIYLIR